MLQRFPGRTLEEIDAIDWGRHQRAWQAGAVESIEQRHNDFIAGRVETLTTDEWEVIKIHNEMVGNA